MLWIDGNLLWFHLISCKTINIPEIFSGIHSFTGKTVIGIFLEFIFAMKQLQFVWKQLVSI